MGNTAQIFWSMIFGSIGLGFFVYGKKQKAVIPLLAGIALILFPYFISNTYILVSVGFAISATPIVFK